MAGASTLTPNLLLYTPAAVQEHPGEPMTSRNPFCRSIAGLVIGLFISVPTLSQQVYEGTDAVPPLFAGQTRAPLAPKSPPFIVSDFVTGLTRPWAIAHMPNGRMIVTEVPGRIRIVTPDGKVSDPVTGVPAVRGWGSRGLNDIILDPDFARNRRIYFSYLAPPPGMASDNSDETHRRFDAESSANGRDLPSRLSAKGPRDVSQ